jgi:hypothetical protein
MEKILFEIKDQIYQTITLSCDFLKHLDTATLLLSIGLLYALFLRKWPLRKILSFVLIVLLLFILLVRTETLLTAVGGADNMQMTVGLARTVFIILVGLILIYNTAIKD